MDYEIRKNQFFHEFEFVIDGIEKFFIEPRDEGPSSVHIWESKLTDDEVAQIITDIEDMFSTTLDRSMVHRYYIHLTDAQKVWLELVASR